jgi:hypothetical protein
MYPAVDFPTGDVVRSLGTGDAHAFLPVWVQKSLGNWTTFAGVGFWINAGVGNRDCWYLGWALQRQIADGLTIGGEFFHQTSSAIGVKDQTGFTLGATYDLSKHYHLLFSAGEGVQNRSTTNVFTYYVSFQLTF